MRARGVSARPCAIVVEHTHRVDIELHRKRERLVRVVGVDEALGAVREERREARAREAVHGGEVELCGRGRTQDRCGLHKGRAWA